VHTTLPYTLAVYLVRDLLPSASESRVGAVTGALAACWCAAQFGTSILWGKASDVIGRKPLILISAAASGVSVLFFASSSTVAAAAAARLVGGALNSTFVSLKCILGESCPPGGQAKPMSLLALGWGAGCLAGPAAGGLSHPCASAALARWLPGATCAPGGLFAASPFLLPGFVAAGCSVAALVVATLFLPETLPRRADAAAAARARASGRHLARIMTASSPYVAGARDAGADRRGGGLLSSLSSLVAGPRAAAAPQPADVELTTTASAQEEDAPLLGGGGGRGPAPPVASPFASTPPPAPPSLDPPKPAPPAPWHHHTPALTALAGYGTVAFLFNLLDELVPLFASAPASVGGLGLAPAALALPLAAGGVALIAWSQLGYHVLAARVGTVAAAKLGLGPAAPLALLLPLPSLLAPALAVPLLSALLCLRSVVANNSFTSSMVLVNESAPPGSIGAVNGAGQTLASLARAVGPAAAGGLWALAAVTPGGWAQWIPFAVVGAACAAGTTIFDHVTPPPGEEGGVDGKAEGDADDEEGAQGASLAAAAAPLPLERQV
jgi:MFS family permease